MTPEYQSYWDGLVRQHGEMVAVGGQPEHESAAQPAFIKKQGLKPEHYFLDFGCGCLRGTLGLVDYLEPGHYYGLDCSPMLLEAARHRSAGCTNRPILAVNSDFNILGACGRKFDFILAMSVMTHLYLEDVPLFLEGIRDALEGTGKAFFTILLDDQTRGGVVEARHHPNFVIEKANQVGLNCRSLEGDYENFYKDHMNASRANTEYLGQWAMEATCR